MTSVNYTFTLTPVITHIGENMITETKTVAAPSSGNVTIEEIRAIIGDTDPNEISSPKLRELLGKRGSYETIGKFLKALRAEHALKLNPPIESGAMPALPVEAANAIWGAAWTAAQVSTLTRMEKLAAERDAALVKLDAQSIDIEGLVIAVDEQTVQLEQAAAEAASAAEAHQAEINAMNAVHQEYVDKLEATQKELAENKLAASMAATSAAATLAKVQTDAAHAAEMAEQGRAMMREELARLTDQVGELKSHLYKRAESSTMAVQPPSPAGQ